LLVIALVALCGFANAQPNSAARTFDEGLAHFRRKEFSDAAESFYKAYRLAPHADALYNAGLAWELAGDPSSAATAYEKAIAMEQLGPDALNDSKTRLAKIAKSLGRVEVSAPEGSTIAVAPFAFDETKAAFYFDPGKRTVSVTLASGRKIERGVQAVAGQTTVVLIEASSPSSGDADSDDDGPIDEPARHSGPGPDKPQSGGSDLKTLGWIALGVSAVAVGTAIVLGFRTLDARDEYNDSKPRTADKRDVAIKRMHWTNYAWATAVVTGAAGAGILLFAPPDSPTKSAMPLGVQFRGQF
jgi:hypothetical protein